MNKNTLSDKSLNVNINKVINIVNNDISNQLIDSIDKHIEDFDITDVTVIPDDDSAPLMGLSSSDKKKYLGGDSVMKQAESSSENNKWNIKQSFSKTNTLNNTQLGIVYNVLKNGNESVNIFEPDDDEHINTSDHMRYGINRYNFEIETLYTSKYKMIENVEFKDFMMTVFDYVNEGKVLLIQNQYKAKIFMTLEENKTTNNYKENSLSDIGYILTKIKNGIIYSKPRDYKDVQRYSNLINYACMIAYKIKHGKYTKYTCKLSYTKYISPLIKNKFNVVLIPKDLQKKFNKPGKYFEEIKNVLKINTDNGFYSYQLENAKIPILCTHEYMIYEGKPLSEVSIKCYKKGKCKYCGQELSAYHEQIKENLPPKIYDLIYKYMSTINENIEESSLMYTLFSLIYDSIKENVDKSDVKNYDASVVSFAALYLYVVYTKTKGSINYNNKINKFLDSAKKYWTEVGWTNEIIENATKNTNIFSNMSNITELIREKIYTNKITFLDLLPISILFSEKVEPKDYDKLEAKTKMQKLWKSGEDKVKQFNELFNDALLSRWKFNYIKNSVESIGKEKINTSFEIFSVKSSKIKNGEKFFFATCETYCPVSEFHEWDDKHTCKKCGLKKDKSNKKEIYDKYQVEINNSYLQKPHVLDDERFKIDKLFAKEQIDAYKADDLFTKYLIIDNHILKQSLEKSIDNKLYLDEILKFISTMTTIEIKNLEPSPEFIKKSIGFIIDKKIKSENEVLNELKNIYFKIKNIDWLLIQ